MTSPRFETDKDCILIVVRPATLGISSEWSGQTAAQRNDASLLRHVANSQLAKPRLAVVVGEQEVAFYFFTKSREHS